MDFLVPNLDVVLMKKNGRRGCAQVGIGGTDGIRRGLDVSKIPSSST